jgi:hypothetical protein
MILKLPRTQYGYRVRRAGVSFPDRRCWGAVSSRIAQAEHSVNKNERSFNCETIRPSIEHLCGGNFRSIELNPCSDTRRPVKEVLRE